MTPLDPRPLALLALLAGTLVGPLAVPEARPRAHHPESINGLSGPDLSLEGTGHSFLITGLQSGAGHDTAWFGGTVWSADSSRWEAIPGGTWTFESGIGSALVDSAGGNKPVGYHRLMEGWYGLDVTASTTGQFRRSTTCALNGSWSMWAGLTDDEAYSLIWPGGQGYGNSWAILIEQTFDYPGSGTVLLEFEYAVDSEPFYDYLRVRVRRSDSAGFVELAAYDGLVGGSASFLLSPGAGTLPSGPGTVTIEFLAESDPSYSDEDGYFVSTCGLAVVDDIRLSGAIVHTASFETGVDGWTTRDTIVGDGDITDLRHVNDLTPTTGFSCNDCGLMDSVLVFVDENGDRPSFVDTWLTSPWIDLRAAGQVGRPRSVLRLNYDSSPHLGVSPAVQYGVQYYPYLNPYTGDVTYSPWMRSSIIYFFGLPVCGLFDRDLGVFLPPTAEQVRVCFTPTYLPTGVDQPYVDNVRFGVFGPSTAPAIHVQQRFQDAFPVDATEFWSRPARVDAGITTGASPVHRDTLAATSNGTNAELRLFFQVRPGPFTDAPALAAVAARWTPEPAIGPGWYSARMDTAEVNGIPSSGFWMTTFHESDPGFQGTDRSLDPNDPGRLANDILPDHVFTPGSRVDYFLAARYIPGDPRNPGGTNWYVVPDTTGGNFWEMEVLPSSMAADTTWNCLLRVSVDGYSGTVGGREIEEAALEMVLGPGGANAEGTRHDRFDLSPMTPLSLGRVGSTTLGATLDHLLAYRTIIWASGQGYPSLEAVDANLLTDWLTHQDGVTRSFWGHGVDFVSGTRGRSPAGEDFLRTTLGVNFHCSAPRNAGCPTGSALDDAQCLPLESPGAAPFLTSGPATLSGSGCPDLRSHDVLTPEPLLPAQGQLSYVKNGAASGFASIAMEASTAPEYRSVVDGFPVWGLRRPSGDPGGCVDDTPVFERTYDVLSWLATSGCPVVTVAGVPDGAPEAPPGRLGLGPARPNPTTGRTHFAVTAPGNEEPIRIDIFDVAGRRIRLLHDGALPRGVHDLVWDGVTTEGRPAGSGLYFARAVSGRWSETRRLVLLR